MTTDTASDPEDTPAVGIGATVERTVRRADRWQQGAGPVAFAYAVVKKYGDDRGGALSALIAFYGFLSLFPLLLIAFTVLGFMGGADPQLAHRLQKTAFGQFPVVGLQLQDTLTHKGGLHGSPVALVIGLLGLLWGATGVAQGVQYAMNQVWSVPNNERPGFLPRTLRSLGFLGVLAGGVVAGAALAGFGSFASHIPVWPFVAIVGSVGVNVAMFLLGYRVVSPRSLSWRELLPGAVVAGIGWTVLQTIGVSLVKHQVQHASEVYGTFGTVLGLISFLSLGAQLSVYAAELNAVRARRLWPRSIVQPPLTGPDREVLIDLVRQEQRRDDQQVDVSFDG